MPVREAIGRFKYVPESDVDAEFDEVKTKLTAEIDEACHREEE